MSGLSVDVNMVAWICWSGLPYMLHHVDSPILEYGRLDASHPHSSSQHSWDDLYLRFRRQVRIEHTHCRRQEHLSSLLGLGGTGTGPTDVGQELWRWISACMQYAPFL